jgi:NitT/TauT family transport system ATP-binding protein
MRMAKPNSSERQEWSSSEVDKPFSILSCNDVAYTYPSGVRALEGVNLEIDSGSVLGIVGPSGCGKSTLLQLIAGLIQPTAGLIKKNIEPSAVTHPLTMVFQHDTLLPWLPAWSNVLLYKRFERSGSRFQRRRISAADRNSANELLEMVGLGRFADAYPYQLSGGMRRRLAFITAVAAQPALLLLDEPFSSVDEPSRIQIHQDVLNIIRRQGMTVILVTHDIAEAISLSDSVIIFSRGPGHVYKKHAIPFGQDRSMVALRQQADFLELYGELWHDLSSQLA